MRIVIITVSDRASKGIYEDRSGPEIERIIAEAYPARVVQAAPPAAYPARAVDIEKTIVPDEEGAIIRAFDAAIAPAGLSAADGGSADGGSATAGNAHPADWIITTGGTGIGPRDRTADVTAGYCDYLLPGIAETLRAESYKETPNAMLSRGTAGVKGNTIIVNFPGSVKGASLCTRVILPILEHALLMMRGEGHG